MTFSDSLRPNFHVSGIPKTWNEIAWQPLYELFRMSWFGRLLEVSGSALESRSTLATLRDIVDLNEHGVAKPQPEIRDISRKDAKHVLSNVEGAAKKIVIRTWRSSRLGGKDSDSENPVPEKFAQAGQIVNYNNDGLWKKTPKDGRGPSYWQ